jgi:hypothetical protein
MDEHGSGWITFSAVILVMAGVMKLFDSIWAFRTKGSFNDSNLALGSTVRNYGWYWLILGILLILAGFGVLRGSQAARWFGIFAAAIAAVGSMAWIPVFATSSLIYFIVAVLVIYGLAAHGGLEVPSQSSSPPSNT